MITQRKRGQREKNYHIEPKGEGRGRVGRAFLNEHARFFPFFLAQEKFDEISRLRSQQGKQLLKYLTSFEGKNFPYGYLFKSVKNEEGYRGRGDIRILKNQMS